MPTRPSDSSAGSTRGRRVPRVSGDDREAAILRSAEQLLDQTPLSRISIDDLASAAGISRPTFYFYFRSKDEVLLTLVDRLVQRTETAIQGLTVSPDAVRDSWSAALSVYFDTFRSQPGVVMACAEALFRSEPIRQVWAKATGLWIDRTAAAIESERARGAAPDGMPARDLAVALNAMNERVIYNTLVGDQPALDPSRAVEVLVEVWIRAIYADSSS